MESGDKQTSNAAAVIDTDSCAALFPTQRRLELLAADRRQSYLQAVPFPHVVIDDFIDSEVLNQVVDEFPQKSARWKKRIHRNSRKFALNDVNAMGPVTRHVLGCLNSQPFLDFLGALTGIEELKADPHLEGGGLHQIERGGFLAVHADFNWHPRLQLDRRLNLLLYLNKSWTEEYGGALELWDRNLQRPFQVILPVFNRCVIFSTTDFSYHGHPQPLTCPEEMARRSIALYYYSKGRPADEKSEAHSTLYQKVPKTAGEPATNISN